MALFMRVHFMLVFHQSTSISAIKCTFLLPSHIRVYPRVLSCIYVFLATAMLVRCVWEWRRYYNYPHSWAVTAKVHDFHC